MKLPLVMSVEVDWEVVGDDEGGSFIGLVGLKFSLTLRYQCEYGRDFQPSCSKKLSKETSS